MNDNKDNMAEASANCSNHALSVLQKQRSTAKANITRIRKMYEDGTGSLNPIDLECRLEILTSYCKQIFAYQTEIERLNPEDNRRGEVEEVCISAKSMLKSKLGDRRNSSQDVSFAFPQNTSHRLPALKIPKFSGKYSEYKNFIACFNNLVHNDNSISIIEKFNHLVNSLQDEALRTVKAFQINEDNYQLALDRLAERYDKKTLIFRDHISSIFELRKMNKPSANELRNIVDTVSAIKGSLEKLGNSNDIMNAMIIHIVLSKVDIDSKAKWDEQLDHSKLPTWVDCSNILIKRCQFLEINDEKRRPDGSYQKQHNNFNNNNNNKSSNRYSYSSSAGNSEKCSFCNRQGHSISGCTKFIKLHVPARFDFVKKNSLCLLCLKSGHSVKVCQKDKCSRCGLPHNILLHNEELLARHKHFQYNNNNGGSGGYNGEHSAHSGRKSSDTGNTNCFCSSTSRGCGCQGDLSKSSNNSQQDSTVLCGHSNDKQIILATASVKIIDRCGNYQIARALLDSGSQVNLITEEMAQRLHLNKSDSELNIVGVGNNSRKVTKCVNAVVRSFVNNFEFSSKYFVMKSIIHKQPSVAIEKDRLGIPKNVVLADPEFNRPQKIDVLIGAESFFELLSVGQIKLGPSLPILQKTLLGWIVSGKCEASSCSEFQHCQVVVDAREDDLNSLNKIVERFWELEQVPSCNKMTEEQLLCESHFVKTTSRIEDGRFEVRLPFKTDPKVLGNSFEIAKRRFLALERKVAKDSNLREMYVAFMKEYLHLGHMSPIKNEIPSMPHYFIPHQCVLRAQSTTTKLRVVFDASSKSSTLVSLNETLMVGPTIQKDLFSALLQFRLNKYAITADVTKMYRQVRVHKDDRRFQLILWREKPDMQIQIYELNTVTYGTAPAPFLAIRCLKEISDIFKDVYPLGASVIANDFYVDDLLSGADDVVTLMQIRKEVIHILSSCGFSLAKWYSNCDELKSDELSRQLELNDSDSTRALGIIWKPDNDQLCFKLEDDFSHLSSTKRNILSISSRLFDPLGLLAPIVIKAKMLLQELWENNLDWDESIPQNLENIWQNFKVELTKVDSIKLPRFVGTTLNSNIQIHGFADASIKAYGCCLYIRYRDVNGFSSKLLVAKSKVAPSRKVKTLPRLELCAAHILAKLWCVVKPKLEKYKIESLNFWSDSEIVLHWLKTHPSVLQTFVSNRVAEIQEKTSEVVWRYVPSSHNPADIVSRGCEVQELRESIWFTGPSFILQGFEEWPKSSNPDLSPEYLSLEKKKTVNVATLIKNSPKENIILKFIETRSSYNKIIRIVGYMLRFIVNLKNKRRTQNIHNTIPVISVKEREISFLKIVQMIQEEDFVTEISMLEKGLVLKNNKLQKLNPFLDKSSYNSLNLRLLRVGGRLSKSNLPYESKYPVLLNKSSYFIKTYLRHLHISNCHVGPQGLLSLSREKIWVVNGRELVRKIVNNCLPCFRFKPKLATQIMGDLPKDRVTSSHPFEITGVDLCGPVHTTLKIRGRPPVKTYIAVFVCFASKAVHLEALSDLSTDCFLSTLHRFISRRGLPRVLWSDNGTNFTGTANLWNQKSRESVTEEAAQKGIIFRFIPPRAPHMGGLWEAAVKSAKVLLVKTLGEALLTFEEFSTLLAEIEAVLNSRPICQLCPDPSEEGALTPGHLLIGRGLKMLPEPEERGNKADSLKRYRRLTLLREHFWNVWRRDYVTSLQQRGKWLQEERGIEVGEIVIVHEDNLPPMQWLIGRIIEVVPGKDGKVRVATVQTRNGLFKRPIHKLAPLPPKDISQD